MADDDRPVRQPRKRKPPAPAPMPAKPTPSRLVLRWNDVRDMVLFLGGLLGVGHETLAVKTTRPELLIVFGAMMGLPAFLRTDERRK